MKPVTAYKATSVLFYVLVVLLLLAIAILIALFVLLPMLYTLQAWALKVLIYMAHYWGVDLWMLLVFSVTTLYVNKLAKKKDD